MIIRHTISALICVMILCSAASTRAEDRFHTQAMNGGRGLLYMQSARTSGKGVLTFGLKSFAMEKEYRITTESGALDDVMDFPSILAVPVTFGLTEEVDLTASLFAVHDARGWKDPLDISQGYTDAKSGLSASHLGLKIRLPRPVESRIQFAAAVGAMLGTSLCQMDGLNYRWTRDETDVDASLLQTIDLTPRVSVYFQEGYVLTGSDEYDDQVTGAAGLRVRVKPWWQVSLETSVRSFLGTGPESLRKAGFTPSMYNDASGIGNPLHLLDNDTDYTEDFLIVAPSMSFKLNSLLTFDIGGVINLADHTSPSESFQIIAGITFNTRFNALIDSDRDGVRDNIDIEPATPRGYAVDKQGRALDGDRDGVPDAIDREARTPLGAKIDEYGVGIDTDGDGVYDGLDMELHTPYGNPVDSFGVALDSDRDGVPDGFDLERNTVSGALVNENGVALDDDGDGVPNGIDMETDTPRGAVVDSGGTSVDSDGDGVPDGIDMEKNTPEGLLVDKSGRALIRQEFSLLNEGLIRLNTILYTGGTADIPPDAYHIIDEVGAIMMKYPSLRIQIEGHTDDTGDPAANMKLARDRARKVLEELLARFPDLDRERFRVVGFGSDKPVASNNTLEGRHANRRVEFVIINRQTENR